jgi:hypothetical protein
MANFCRGDESSCSAGNSLSASSAVIILLENPPPSGVMPPSTPMIRVTALGRVPPAIPMDENIAPRPESASALAKLMGEAMARQVAARTPLSGG